MAQNLGDLFIDGESIIEDETGTHAISNSAGVSLDTNDKKVGDSSIDLSLTSDYLSVTKTAVFDLGTNNFTIDFWMKANEWPTNTYAHIFSQGYQATNNYRIYFNTDFQYLTFESASGGGVDFRVSTANYSLNQLTSAWHHIAVVKYGTGLNEMMVFINGNPATLTWNKDMPADYSFPSHLGGPRIGVPIFTGTVGVPSHIDNFRFSGSEALWTSSFDIDDPAAMRYSGALPLLSDVYEISHVKNNLRGKASQGFIRPTIKQFFTSANFEEITSITAKFDSEAKATDIVLSNEDLTATNNASSDFSWVSVSVSPDIDQPSKTYAEFEVVAKYADNLMLGIIFDEEIHNYNSSDSYQNGTFPNRCVVLSGNGYCYYPDVGMVTNAFSAGDIIGITFDTTTKQVSFYYNNVHKYTGTIDLSLGVCRYAAFLARYTGIYPTVNFLRPNAHNYSPPVGFTAFG